MGKMKSPLMLAGPALCGTLLLLTGCGAKSTTLLESNADGGVGGDGPTSEDAGRRADAGVDAGRRVDAGRASDGGPRVDGGPVDVCAETRFVEPIAIPNVGTTAFPALTNIFGRVVMAYERPLPGGGNQVETATLALDELRTSIVSSFGGGRFSYPRLEGSPGERRLEVFPTVFHDGALFTLSDAVDSREGDTDLGIGIDQGGSIRHEVIELPHDSGEGIRGGSAVRPEGTVYTAVLRNALEGESAGGYDLVVLESNPGALGEVIEPVEHPIGTLSGSSPIRDPRVTIAPDGEVLFAMLDRIDWPWAVTIGELADRGRSASHTLSCYGVTDYDWAVTRDHGVVLAACQSPDQLSLHVVRRSDSMQTQRTLSSEWGPAWPSPRVVVVRDTIVVAQWNPEAAAPTVSFYDMAGRWAGTRELPAPPHRGAPLSVDIVLAEDAPGPSFARLAVSTLYDGYDGPGSDDDPATAYLTQVDVLCAP